MLAQTVGAAEASGRSGNVGVEIVALKPVMIALSKPSRQVQIGGGVVVVWRTTRFKFESREVVSTS